MKSSAIYVELYCAIFSSVSCVSCTSCDHPLFPAYIRACVLCNTKLQSVSKNLLQRTMKVSEHVTLPFHAGTCLEFTGWYGDL